MAKSVDVLMLTHLTHVHISRVISEPYHPFAWKFSFVRRSFQSGDRLK